MGKLTKADIETIIVRLGQVAKDDIAWSSSCAAPNDAEDFASEAIFVICNSGMKNTIARQIHERVMKSLLSGLSSREVFGHAGKSAAIDHIWGERADLFEAYTAADDKVAFCETLPFIGGITKYHLAKNFGAQVAKPDVHLQRLANSEGVTAQQLCERLAVETGYSIATIDVLLWRACANGILNSRALAPAGRTALSESEAGK